MSISAQIEQESTERLLTRLSDAIEEAKHARSTIVCSNLAKQPTLHESVSRNLKLINREIELLEAKRLKVRCQANRSKKINVILRLKLQALINHSYSRIVNDYIVRCSRSLKYTCKHFLY